MGYLFTNKDGSWCAKRVLKVHVYINSKGSCRTAQISSQYTSLEEAADRVLEILVQCLVEHAHLSGQKWNVCQAPVLFYIAQVSLFEKSWHTCYSDCMRTTDLFMNFDTDKNSIENIKRLMKRTWLSFVFLSHFTSSRSCVFSAKW